MNSFYVYIPGKFTSPAAAFAHAGLSSILPNASSFDSHRTPEGEGKFYVWTDPTNPAKNVPFHYEAETQTWEKSADGKFWLGWCHDRVPDPESLERTEGVGGVMVKLGDGNLWRMPSINALPVSFRLGVDGKEGAHVKPGWKGIENRMLWAWRTLEKQVNGELPNEAECRRYVAEMLCVNYRMVHEIAYMLGLIDSETWVQAFAMTLDWQRLRSLKREIVNTGEFVTPAP
jgi:hypothetical protein